MTGFDLGKALLQYAKEDDLKGVQQVIACGAPVSSDWVKNNRKRNGVR